LEIVSKVSAEQDIPLFLVGAYARDIMFQFGLGVSAPRATVDVDLAVEVSSWSAYEALKEVLLTYPGFKDDRQRQRVVFRNSIPVDIVPFGNIADSNDEIAWPPDSSIRMLVTGFDDAIRCAQPVRFRSTPGTCQRF
jgi:predicted nucleotidyltransferase